MFRPARLFTLGSIFALMNTPAKGDLVETSSPPLTAKVPMPSLSSVPADQPLAEILSEVGICKQPQRYIGWPSIISAENGDLVVVFSGDRDWHVCPWGKIFLTRSSDGGKTWSEPEVVVDTPLDDRDAGLVRLSNGDLLLSFNSSLAFDNSKVERYQKYQEHAATLTPEIREKWKGMWNRVSKDNGRTWGPSFKTPTGTPHGPTSMKNGKIIYVRPSVFTSENEGETWSEIAQIERNPTEWKSRYAFLSEQHAVECADGTLVALSRYASKGGNSDIELRQIESSDEGKTWTQPRKTGMEGYPAHLLRLKNDWLLAVYGHRVPPLGQRASISKDNGKTWLVDEEIILSNAVPQGAGDLGYPSSAQLPDGSIWTVYYQVEKTSDGEFPSLMATHWKLKP